MISMTDYCLAASSKLAGWRVLFISHRIDQIKDREGEV